MRRLTAAFADETITPSDRKYHFKKRNYSTDDIVKLVLWGDKRVKHDTEEFAKAIPATKEGMRMLFDFIVEHIKYKQDPKGSQWVRSPARTWDDRHEGSDCKSWTLLITSVLQNLGLSYIIRFTAYKSPLFGGNPKPTHVYPIAILPTGEQVIVDPVWHVQEGGLFNTEKPYKHKVDHKMKKGLAFLSGTEEQENIIEAVEMIDRSIPNSYLEDDITQKTEGELQRFLMAQRFEIAAEQVNNYSYSQNLRFAAGVVRAGAGSIGQVASISEGLQRPVLRFLETTAKMNRPAIIPPKLLLYSDQELAGFFKNIGKGIKNAVNQVGKGVKNAVNSIGKFFKQAWAKLMNWIFKSGLVNSGPYFLFSFIKKDQLPRLGREVNRRVQAQAKTLGWLKKLGLKSSNIEAAVKNGIIKHMGAAPEKILNDKAKAQIAGDSVSGLVAAIFKAVGWLIQTIKKIVALFKKGDDKPVVSEENASDLEYLDTLGQNVAKESPGYSGDGYEQSTANQSAQGGGGMLFLLGLLGLGLAA